LVNYYDQANNEKVKLELLETLSSLLDISEQDKIRMGLEKMRIEKMGQTSTDKDKKPEGIKGRFLSFLRDD
jgi:hypothetical protein